MISVHRHSHRLISTLLAIACTILPYVTRIEAVDPPPLNVTVFSFSLDSSVPSNALDLDGGAGIFASLASDLSFLTFSSEQRVYRVALQWQREDDPYPDIVYLGDEKEDGHAPNPASLSRGRKPTILSRSSHGRNADNGGVNHRFETQSLELLRISLCFLPSGFENGVYFGPPAAQYEEILRDMLSRWRMGDSVTLPSLSQGNITQHIHPLIPMTIENATLIYCPDEPPSARYYITCPIRDPTLYWGTTGLLVAIVLSLALFLTIFFSVWYIYTKVENKRLRGNIAHIKPEYRSIIFGPHNTRFKQHTLDTFEPQWTVRKIMKGMCVIGLGLFIPLGIWATVANNRLIELSVRYDNLPECSMETATSDICHVLIPITQHMRAPIYMYYSLHNFYQNHRNYVQSRSDPQLRNAGNKGSNAAPNLAQECQALRHFGDWGDRAHTYPFSSNVTEFLAPKTLYPCGLIASSFFTDKFSQARVTSQKIIDSLSKGQSITGPSSFELQGRNWCSENIAWKSDRDSKYIQRPIDLNIETNLNPRGLPDTPARAHTDERFMQFPSIDNEDFIIWMRVAPFSSFAKLSHMILDRDLHAGEVVNITVTNLFSVAGFNGEKSIILATANSLGTKNNFFSVAFLLVGCIYGATGIGLFLLFRRDPDPIPTEDTLQLALDAQAEADSANKAFEASMAPTFKAAKIAAVGGVSQKRSARASMITAL